MRGLKGKDIIVACSAINLGLDVYLVPYLNYHDGCQDDMICKLRQFPSAKPCPTYMAQSDVNWFFGLDPSDVDRDKTFSKKHIFQEADMWIMDGDDWGEQYDLTPEQYLGETEYNYNGYFGNEASDICFYARAVLFIEIPSYSAREAAFPSNPDGSSNKKAKLSLPQEIEFFARHMFRKHARDVRFADKIAAPSISSSPPL